MVKIKAKKRKLVKKSEQNSTNPKITKKVMPKKKKNSKTTGEKSLSVVPISNPEPDAINRISGDSSSDEDGSSESNHPEYIQKLLEPYTKAQLIDFIVDAAINDESLCNRIHEAADRDVSHRKIFVYGLGWDTTRDTLTAAFEPFGEIEECNVVTDRATGKAKGFGFVLFKSRKGTVKALKDPQKKIKNRMASCQLAFMGPVPSSDSANRKIYVSNVQADVDPEKLRGFFSKFGEIEMGPLGFDVHTGKSRGFALFVYKNQEGVRKVLEDPYKMFDGHQLHCQKAADGKSKGASSSSAVAPVQQVLTPTIPGLSAAVMTQDLAYLSQYSGLNPMYGGVFANPNVGFLAGGQVNPLLMAGGLGQLGQGGTAGRSMGNPVTGIAAPTQGLGMGLNQPVLGSYGLGLQDSYPTSQMGGSGAKTQGAAGGSFSGYPSHW